MAFATRPLKRLLITLPVLLLLALAGLALRDHWTRPSYTYEPVLGPTALDSWQAPWAVDGGTASAKPSIETVDGDTPGQAAGTSPGLDAPEQVSVPSCSQLPEKWMVIGWDGAEWEILIPLLEAGKLPHLESLMRQGTYGNLASFIPNISPAIWTTVATGVSPERHGIKHFYNKRPALERWWSRLRNFGELDRYLYSNADRRAPALWNVLSERQRSVLMVGYHNTFPVEEVHGMMVSNYLVQDSIGDLMQMRSDGNPDSQFGLSLVHPQDHLAEVLDIQEKVHQEMVQHIPRFVDLDDGELKSFIRQSRNMDRQGDLRPYFLTRAYTYDTILAEVAERFLPEIDPDVFSVHFQSLDWADHYFLYYHYPERFAEMEWSPEVRQDLEAHLPMYRRTVESFYVYMDEWLGRFLELRDADTAVVVLSDHGVGPGEDPKVPGYHDDAPPGMVVWNGPGIRRQHRLEGATVYDILPTLMAGLELPVAEDLEGRVLSDVFCSEAWEASRQETLASYHQGDFYVPQVAKPSQLSNDLVDQLESLGYIK